MSKETINSYNIAEEEEQKSNNNEEDFNNRASVDYLP